MMTVHKLTAGDGYTYLTRQVASADERRPRGQELADYYVTRGNPPGVWLGTGAMALDLAGTEVSEAQMRALFGDGCHPDRERMLAEGATVADTKLGRAYPNYGPATRADTSDRTARKARRAVAGFDLVFTPVKSASLLWALGGPAVREQVEAAHHEAVQNTLGWIEEHAAFTRAGAGGRAQIDTSGLICAAFDHRESRTGDPDLHTHLAIANKVLGVDSTWRALDARGLHALGVAASERYNTRFEDALTRRLGVRFVDRPGRGPGKRPVREVDGVPLRLIRHFSRRRAAIEDRYAELASAYRHQHGRDPDRSTQLHLAQQATLETRDGKPPGRTLAEQVDDWSSQTRQVLGGSGVSAMVRRATGHRIQTVALDDVDVEVVASQVLAVVSAQRSTWSRWNVVAETERALRPVRFESAEARELATTSVVEAATGPTLSVRIAESELIRDPAALRRSSDGESVFVPHGSERYTSSQILVAEERLVAAARTPTTVALDPLVAEAALAVHESASGIALDHGQRQLVLSFLGEPRHLVLGIGPAGTGKTTAMRAFAASWASGGGRVVPLASSSRAAQVLSGELGLRAENVHKFLHEARRSSDRLDPWFSLRHGDAVLVDEAGMAGTLLLRELVDLAAGAGAVVRLLGDPQQLAAPAAGGALRLLETEVGAARLDHLHRFDDPDEAVATLGLRAGDPTALTFYQHRKRIRSGSREAMLEAAYDGWSADLRAGLTSVLVAAASEDVAAMSARARVERVHLGQVEPTGIELHDGNRAGVGDWVVTRTNLRGLTCNRGRDWVKNGDLWSVVARHDDGGLTVRSFAHGGNVHLAGPYVADQVELGYATTAHRAQGTTVDTAHPLVSPEMTREALYVASTRARSLTTWYVAVEDQIEADADHEPPPAREAREVLCSVLARVGGQTSATETLRAAQDDACSLPTLVSRYRHARDIASRDAVALAAQSALSPGLASRLLADPAVGVVARSLANAAGAGEDIVSVLRAVADARELRTADSPARILAYRLDDYAGSIGFSHSAQADRPLPWLPSPEVGHPGWRDYLVERARLISDRAEQLTASSMDRRLPGWASSLGPRPDAADARGLWQTAVGLAAAYREQYAVGADLEPLGEPPDRGTGQERAYRIAARAIEDARLAEAPPTTSRPSPSMPSRQRECRTYKPSLHL